MPKQPSTQEQTPLQAEQYFAALPSALRTFAEAVRKTILSALPDLHEELKFGVPFYVYKGWVCYLNASEKGYVDIAFTAGVELSDTFTLFEHRGTKQVRHIRIPDEAFLREHEEEITNYIIEACVRNDTKRVNKGASNFRRSKNQRRSSDNSKA